METLYRLISGLTAGFIALFAPIGPLVACAMAFIGIDFLSGVAASRAAARRKGHTWYFESCEAWRTVLKLGLTVTAIAMAWEAAQTGSAERLRLSQLVLLHRVLPRDPLDDAAAVPAQWLE